MTEASATAPPRARRRPPVTPVLAVAALAAVVGAVVAVGGSGSSGTATRTTRTVTVERGVIQSTVSGSGSLAARRDRELAFASAGTIKKVWVSTGERVSKGQVLARLKTTDDEIRRLRAPFAGRVAAVDVAVGDTVGGVSSSSSGATGATGGASTDTTTAFEVVSLKSYEMSVSLSESDIGKVKKGQAATVTVEATGDKLAARVQRVSLLPASSSDSAGATGASSSSSAVAYSVTLRLTQSARGLRAGNERERRHRHLRDDRADRPDRRAARQHRHGGQGRQADDGAGADRPGR